MKMYMKKIILLIIPFILFAEEKKLSSVLIGDGYKKPVFITSYPNNSKLLYVVEQAGLIKIIKNGKKNIKAYMVQINGLVNSWKI